MKTKLLLTVILTFLCSSVRAGDWPMWRRDAARSATAAEALPGELYLQWVRHLPPLVPAYRNSRLQFDAGYEPVVLGKTMFVASSASDSVTAYDTDNGAEKWRFTTNGPVRFAPVAWQGKVYFGSDDGHLYCLDSESGRLQWKFRAVPSKRMLLGNERLISLWPVRGGPVLHEGKIYFAAGVWSFEGVFVYALDAETGKVAWLNDRAGYIYGQHPHAAEAFGGLTPQGYLVVHGDQLIVPCGSALPARFDLKTGKLIQFDLPKKGRYPGGYFAVSAAVRRGEAKLPKRELQFDNAVNKDRHEGGWHTGPGNEKLRTTITVGEKELSFAEGPPAGLAGIQGTIHNMLAADGKLFAVTREGSIYCFGPKRTETKAYKLDRKSLVDDKSIPPLPGDITKHGYALAWGVGDGQFIEKLLSNTKLKVIAVDNNLENVERLRSRWRRAGLYGSRVHLLLGKPDDFDFPPYLASLIFAEKVFQEKDELSTGTFRNLRPYGGTSFFTSQAGTITHRTRKGPLPGSTNYTGDWSSPDKLVKAPLSVLWFGDAVGNFKRAPQPKFVDGVMVTHDKQWLGWVDGERPPFKLTKAVFSDVYTGRVFAADEPDVKAAAGAVRDITKTQLSQYRPPQQKNDWKPTAPVIGTRLNPLTGQNEPRSIIKSYGCDGGNDYGLLFTMRSGTAAYYDKRIESGTIHISGPRSGCTNSIIPACGVLNVPYFYQGCTCSYPLPVGLAMVNMPETYEQWTVWGKGKPGPVQRVGLNFGAPGDRVTEAGTLWLDWPSVGGPSPEVKVTVAPKTAKPFYRHSLWVNGGKGWPWVAASGIEGASTITVDGLKPGTFTVRLYFAEPAENISEKRVFDVSLQDRVVLKDFNIAKQRGGSMRSIVRELKNIKSDGQLKIALTAKQGKPIISGIELIADGLPTGAIVELPNRDTELLMKVK